MSTTHGAPLELMLFPACVMPGCRHLVDEAGDACADCRTSWGPFLHRQGEPSPWPTTWQPSCEHPRWQYRRGRCTICAAPGIDTPADNAGSP